MRSDDPTDFLIRAARRAVHGPAPLVAGLIEAWRKAFPEDAPEKALASSRDTLIELALCRRPRDECWIEDATEIADGLTLDRDHLIAFLRAAETVERFGIAHPVEATQESRLLAARDRGEGD